MLKLKSILTTKCLLFADVIVSHIYESRIHRLGMVKKDVKRFGQKSIALTISQCRLTVFNESCGTEAALHARCRVVGVLGVPVKVAARLRVGGATGQIHLAEVALHRCVRTGQSLWSYVQCTLPYSIHCASNVCSSA